ncbi:hypothetical protein VI03_30985 [Burkholderia vietnamiensis]|nr:hypothetical protein VI03_30985 [Burkholderia vietnamiensis]
MRNVNMLDARGLEVAVRRQRSARCHAVTFCIAVLVWKFAVGGTDTTFGSVATLLAAWLQGSFGHLISLAAEAVILGYAVAKGSTVGSVMGIVGAIALSYGSGIILSVYTATL